MKSERVSNYLRSYLVGLETPLQICSYLKKTFLEPFLKLLTGYELNNKL